MSQLNPAQTIIIAPNEIPWKVPDGSPPDSVAEAVLAGGEDQDGAYMVLMKWYPGWMSRCFGRCERHLMTIRNGGGADGARGPGHAGEPG